MEPHRDQETVWTPWVVGRGVCGLPASQRFHQTPLGSWKPSWTPQSLCCVLWSILSSVFCGRLLSCLEKSAKNVNSKLAFQQDLVLWQVFSVSLLPRSGHYGMYFCLKWYKTFWGTFLMVIKIIKMRQLLSFKERVHIFRSVFLQSNYDYLVTYLKYKAVKSTSLWRIRERFC